MTSGSPDHSLPLETVQEVVGGYANCNQVVDHRYEVETPRKEVASVVCRHAAALTLVRVHRCFTHPTYFIWSETGQSIRTL